MATSQPSVTLTVDVIIPRVTSTDIEVVLIKRHKAPFQGCWALPGGKLNDTDPSLTSAAVREVVEETSVRLQAGTLQQIHTFGDVNRDPRGRYVSVAYLAPLQSPDVTLQAGDDASEAQWWSLQNLPQLAFDHKEILLASLASLQLASGIRVMSLQRQTDSPSERNADSVR